MESSEEFSKAQLFTALKKAQGHCEKVVKDATNPFHKSKYATLESVKAASDDALAKADLVFTSWPAMEGLQCHLVHTKSGENIDWTSPYFMEKNSAQALGSCVTYLRRYNLTSLLNLVAEDDDGEAATIPTRARQAKKQVPPQPKKTTKSSAHEVSSPQKPSSKSVVYEGTKEQKQILARVFEDEGVHTDDWKKTFHDAMINWKVESTADAMSKALKKMMNDIASGKELDEIPFN